MDIYIFILVLAICQLINVFLGTLKTVTTARGKIIVAAISNAVAYGFGALVTKQIATTESYIMVPIAIVTNLVGVYICLTLIDKFKKDKIWEIKTLTDEKNMYDLVNYCREKDIKTLTTKDIIFNNYAISIYSKSRNESIHIFNYLKKHNLQEIKTVE